MKYIQRPNLLHAFYTSLIVLMSIGMPAIAYSQTAYFTKYTEKDGISSNHVYKVFQDSKGYIWLSTSGGVTRFDGENFEVFTTTDGLTDYEIISIFEDSSSRIWFATFNGLPCYYKNGKIYNYENDPLLKGVHLREFIKCFFEDSQKNIWFGSKSKTVKLDYKSNSISEYNAPTSIIHENSEKDVILHLLFKEQININQDPDLIENLPLGKFTKDITTFGISAAVRSSSGGHLFAVQNFIYLKPLLADSIYVLKQITAFDKNLLIRNITKDEKGNYYVATTDGAHICEIDEELKTIEIKETFLKGYTTTSMCTDHQNGYWVSNQSGVYHFKNHEVFQKNPNIRAVNLLAKNKDYLIASEPDNQISVIDISSSKLIGSFKTETEPKFIKIINEEIYLGTDDRIYKIIDGHIFNVFHNESLKDIELSNGKYYLSSSSGIFTIKEEYIDESMIGFEKLRYNEKVEEIFSKRGFKIFRVEEKIYLSTKDGILILDENTAQIDHEISVTNFRPNHITSFENTLIISSYKDGLYLYNNREIEDTLNMDDGLLSNQIIKTIPHQDRLYVITGNGIQYLDNKFNSHNILGLSNIDTKINGAEIVENELIIATANGILSYDLNTNLKRDTETKSDIRITQDGYKINKFDSLQYIKKPVDIRFQIFDFAKIDEGLKYRLYPEDEEWKPIEAKHIIYQGLQPNDYTFQISNNEEVINDFSFHIKKPIWMETWFRILIGSIFLWLVYLYLSHRFKRIIAKKDKDYAFHLKLATAEQKALKAQMNPHFIFNSLNAIQNLILGERTDKAYKYLGDFSKLVRKVLVDSRKIDTTIQREIEFLTLYLELEKLRFEGQFLYSFEYNKNFNLDQIIPAMVIQPFVENSIIHGLVPQPDQDDPQITIKFKEDEKYIYCHISDNGIGFDDTFEESESNTSLGLKIIAERLELYDASGKSKYKIESSSQGTNIILQLIKQDESGNHRR